ncbi:MAG: BatD family protein [Proteobacteria bacterium]|nr:BatD family protein [Pseudomonadota bacterium]
MKKARKALILLFVLYFLTGLTISCFAANNISITLRLNKKEATTLDSIGMVVKISGVNLTDSWPVINGLDSFDVIQRVASSRLEIIKGKFSSAKEYNYMIRPKVQGTYKIGPAILDISGKTITSNTEKITITKPKQSSGINRGGVFLTANISSKKIYIEEQAVYTLKLYHQGNVNIVSFYLPQTESIILKQIEKPPEYQSIYNGKTYHVMEVRYVMIPSKEGTCAIEPARIGLIARESLRGPGFRMFDDPFFLSTEAIPQNVISEPFELKILPLPEKERPYDYTGMVGTFDMKASIEPKKIKKGESATLAVVIEGHGNVKKIPDLKGPKQQNIKIYADRPVLEESVDSEGIKGSKTLKWALVPEKEGQYEISPLTVNFFDTQKQQYRTIETQPLQLLVLPGEKEQLVSSVMPSNVMQNKNIVKKEVKEIGQDILPVHDSLAVLAKELPMNNRMLLISFLLGAPFLCYISAFILIKFNRKSKEAMTAVRIKKAAGIFIRQCSKAKTSSNDMISELRNYLNNRFGLELGLLTANEAQEVLKSKGVSLETADRFRDIILELESAVYTGKGNEVCNLAGKVIEIIKKVEKEIR